MNVERKQYIWILDKQNNLSVTLRNWEI